MDQAWLFGVTITLGRAQALAVHGAHRVVREAAGGQLRARAVVIATGVTWRRLGVPELEALVGAGVFYGAAGAEARAMTGQHVYVIGAGNSAGQAALHLARYAASVTMVVRGCDLRASMSSYLVTQISTTANIRIRPATEVIAGQGQCSLQTLTLRDRASGTTDTVPAAALFVMIGAEPRTAWLRGSVERDEQGFILTGRDLYRTGRPAAGWPLERPPLLLETSIPGVFAAGDVRHRSIKRVASAVGEGATAVQLVHEYLQAGPG
jgi:thioredoxin reductase (NADPH)